MVMLIPLHPVYGYFHTTVLELSSCKGNLIAHDIEMIYCLALYKKCLQIPSVNNKEERYAGIDYITEYICNINICILILYTILM